MSDDDDRLREHPSDRFDPAVRRLTFADEFDQLLEEASGQIDNHRQVSLVHRSGLSLILFYFAAGGTLPAHQTDGEVAIQVLDGELEITTPDETQRVATGEVLILSPGIEHDVEALEATKMLLTITTDGNDAE